MVMWSVEGNGVKDGSVFLMVVMVNLEALRVVRARVLVVMEEEEVVVE